MNTKEYDYGLPDISSGKLFQQLLNYCNFGPVCPGSKEEILVRDYIKMQFENKGLHNVYIEEFDYPQYTNLECGLNIESPERMEITCEPLEYSGNRTSEGELIYLGDFSSKESDYIERNKIDTTNKIIAISSRRPYMIVPELKKLGAAGVIVISDAPQNLIRHSVARMGLREGESMNEYVSEIPGVVISSDDAKYLLTLATTGATRVRLKHQGSITIKKSWNVIGEVPGDNQTSEFVTVGAHYDTKKVGGAWDNGVGVAGLIELAGIFANLHPKRRIEFCAFGCEEIGLFGSASRVQKSIENITKCITYVNLDSTSARIAPINQLYVTPRTRDFALKTVRTKTDWRIDTFKEISPFEYSCDYVAYIKQGVGVIWASQQGNPYFHTSNDTIDTIDIDELNKTTTVAGLCLFDLIYLDNPFEF